MIRATLISRIFVLCGFCAVAIGQDLPRAAAFVGASADGVRFLSSPSVVALRVQVFSPSGASLFDSDWKGGNVLDWLAGNPLAYGSYRIVVESKDLAGQLSRKEATLRVDPNAITVDEMGSESPRITLLAHDGQTGQLVTTSGDLSFRFGDYLNRKDAEAMRLTAAGELQVRGLIRTGEGIVFPDGSVQTSAAMPSIVRMRPSGGVDDKLHPKSDTTGTGTTNQITKWLDTSGTLGDSAISESAGSVVIGSIAAQGQLQIAGSATQDVFAGMGPNIVSGPAMNYGYAGLSFGRGAGFFNVRPDSQATAPNPSLRFMTKNAQRMIITNVGDVGINTLAPAAKLHIVGADGAGPQSPSDAPDALRVVGGTGGFGFGGPPSPTKGGRILLQGGPGGNQGGSGGSIILEPGAGAPAGNVILADIGGLVGVGTAAPTEMLEVNGNGKLSGNLGASGDIVSTGGAVDAKTQFNLNGSRILIGDVNNLFAGLGAGAANTGGYGNVFVGPNAGEWNTTGLQNTYVGLGAGAANGDKGQNSYFGYFSGSRGDAFGNSAFGYQAGQGALGGPNTGSYNSFFGYFTGSALTTGSSNAAFGVQSANVLSTGVENSFFGGVAGGNTTTGSHNTHIGSGAGLGLTTEDNNTMLGYKATGAATVTNATAIGNLAKVEQSDSLVLGSINGKNGAIVSTKVGIGTTTPAETLHVSGGKVRWANSLLTDDQNGSIELGGTDTIAGSGTPYIDFHWNNIAAEDYNVRLVNDGDHRLLVRGTFAVESLGAAGTIALCQNTTTKQIATCSSSIRYKESIATFGRGLDLVRQLRPVTFRWKQDGKADLGLIAEEVAKLEPLLAVYDDAGKVEGVKYDHLTVALINAVQEQQTRLDEERQQNTLLRARLEKVEEALTKLTKNQTNK